MLSPRWRKVLNDLLQHKTRTILVVMSIAIGVFAIGMVAGAAEIMSRDLQANYMAINPAGATIYTDPFDQDFVDAISSMPEIKEAEGRRSTTVRIQTGPDQWRSMTLYAIDDFNNIKINNVASESGAWPPPDHHILLERSSAGYAGLAQGDILPVETPDGKRRQMEVAGLAHDISLIPSFFSGGVYGYITFDTMEWLGQSRSFDRLHIVVAENAADKEHVTMVANLVRDRFEKSGYTVYWRSVHEPGEHPLDAGIKSMVLIMGILGLLTLLLSGFLVINTTSALLTQQIKQIGIMKAIGAQNGQVMAMYLAMVLIFGLLALLVAVPLGALAALLTTRYMAGMMNFDLTVFTIPPHVLALQVAVGLVVPLLAALYPILAGIKITVREALSTYGLSSRYGSSMIDGLLGRFRGFSRPLLLSLRNTFRRKGRLALTLAALTLGGAIFIAVFSVRDSTLQTTNDAFEYFNYDIGVNFSQSYRMDRIEYAALQIPGVAGVESWGFRGARIQRDDGSESDNLTVIAPPADTGMINPVVLQGRWLLPEDENAVVINTDLLKKEPHLAVGDEIVLKIDGRENTWRIVGIVKGVMTGSSAYANYPYFARTVRDVGKASSVQIVTARQDLEFQDEVAKNLEFQFKETGLKISSVETTVSIKKLIESQFNLIIIFLLIMAVLIAVVGGLGLMGTMSINVIERTREIGVMRAIGASDGAVLKIFLTEGIMIGLISWLIGSLMALPISKVLSDAVGLQFMNDPLSYTFSFSGLLIWLGVVVFLSAAASYLPARNATRVSVRDVLAYE